MVSFIERLQSVLAGVILALLIASVVLVPQNRALGDAGGNITVTPLKCPGDICSVNCLSCIVKGPGGGTYCDSGIENVPCRCNKKLELPPGQDCKVCSCEAIWVDEEKPELGKRCSCK